MNRRDFLLSAAAAGLLPTSPASMRGQRLADAASRQLGVTTGYDPAYVRIPYPLGDVPRNSGVCADVVVRAGRDGLGLDLQRLVHEDMLRDFGAYPATWRLAHPDTNIDHRRVPNLETFWRRCGKELWRTPGRADGDGFPGPFEPGDLLTWRLDARLPHVGVVVGHSLLGTQVVHNIGRGVEQSSLMSFHAQRAQGHYRWPV